MIFQDEQLMVFAFPKFMDPVIAPIEQFAWKHVFPVVLVGVTKRGCSQHLSRPNVMSGWCAPWVPPVTAEMAARAIHHQEPNLRERA
jgi:hypothetical protein